MGKDRFNKRKDRRRKIARERIAILLQLAREKAEAGRIDRASRYGHLARKISKRYNVRLPGYFKHIFCKHCGTYRVPGKNTRVRIRDGRVIIHCQKCGQIYRRPVKTKATATPGEIPKTEGRGSNG